MKKFIFAIFFAGFGLLSGGAVQSATINVPAQFSTIKEAVKAAVDGDTVLVGEGVYLENLSIKKNIKIVASGNAASTVIDGKGGETVLLFTGVKPAGDLVPGISGFTIQNGYGIVGRGGGITVFDSHVAIENNSIVNNRASVDAGGILFDSGSTGVVRNNHIEANSAARFGGGIDIVGGSDPLVYNNLIINNAVSGPAYGSGLAKWGASGGGVYVDGNSSPQIMGNTISGNTADFSGAGISLRQGSGSIVENNTINNNVSTTGSGVHIETEGGAPVVRNNDIYSNSALTTATFPDSGFGGGISVYNASQPEISENVIYDNFATKGGGAIVNSENANSTIINNKIYGNETTSSSGEHAGGAIYVADSTATIKNNVMYLNKARLGGGIALLDSAVATINGNTIVDNDAPFDPTRRSGGGIFIKSTVTSASIINNIITQNQDYQIVEWVKKATINNNLINNDDLGIYFSDNAPGINDIATLNNNANVNAASNVSGAEGFVNTAGRNYDITNASAAVDRGTSSGASRYDYAYRMRPAGAATDIGAYEYTTDSSVIHPVYRFWSDSYQRHFYTIEASERNTVLAKYPVNIWRYEGVAYRSYKNSGCVGSNIYRFWSDLYRGHFYTISETEKNNTINKYSTNVWNYEGPSFCARTGAGNGSSPIYRFWSDQNGAHFYTASEAEKNHIIASYSDRVWRYEGIGYYAYPKN